MPRRRPQPAPPSSVVVAPRRSCRERQLIIGAHRLEGACQPVERVLMRRLAGELDPVERPASRSAAWTPLMQSMAVLLPEPVGPMRPTTAPVSTVIGQAVDGGDAKIMLCEPVHLQQRVGAAPSSCTGRRKRATSRASSQPPRPRGNAIMAAISTAPYNTMRRSLVKRSRSGIMASGGARQHAPEASRAADDHHDQHRLGVVEIEDRGIDDR